MPPPAEPLPELPDLAIIASVLRRAGCVFAEEEAYLLLNESVGHANLARNVELRSAGVPLEYVLGWAEFAGLRIVVDPGVFVPRRRTELLVAEAGRILAAGGALPRPPVVDLCCGTGAVGAALLAARPGLELHAADIDPAAVNCAKRNLEHLGGHVHQGDLFQALPLTLLGRVEVLAVNAPYVPSDAIRTMPPEARLYEPRLSLDGGTDGLGVQRRVAASADTWLSPTGNVLIETSGHQAAGTASILSDAGLAVRIVRSEELDGTVVVGTARR